MGQNTLIDGGPDPQKMNDWNWGASPLTKEKVADIVLKNTLKTTSQTKKSKSSTSPST